MADEFGNHLYDTGAAITTTGSANAYVLATATPINNYYVGMPVICFKASFANTGSATLNVNGLGAVTLKKNGGAANLASGEIASGGVYSVAYDGTNFQVLELQSVTDTSGFGDVSGPVSATSGNLASFNGTSGKIIQDSGKSVTSVGAGKQTVWIPATAMITRTTNGAAAGTVEMTTNKNMFKTLDFDATTQEFAQFEIFFPKSWNSGTVTFQPVLSHASGSGNVVFGLAGVARSDDDAGDVAFGTAQTSDKTVGTANDIYIGPESSAITIAGTPAAGDTVQFQINRTVASDSLGVDARLHGIRLFYTTTANTDD